MKRISGCSVNDVYIPNYPRILVPFISKRTRNVKISSEQLIRNMCSVCSHLHIIHKKGKTMDGMAARHDQQKCSNNQKQKYYLPGDVDVETVKKKTKGPTL